MTNNIVICPLVKGHDCPYNPEDPVFGFDGCNFYFRGKMVHIGAGNKLALMDVLWRKGECTETELITAMHGTLDVVVDERNNLAQYLFRLRKALSPLGIGIDCKRRSFLYEEGRYKLSYPEGDDNGH